MARHTPERSIRSAAPVPPIRIGVMQEKEGLANRQLLLVIFMRVVALLWIGEGLFEWAAVLADADGSLFASASLQRISAIVFFCILDLIAAVGLWLATPWGGVVWLVTVGGQMLSLGLLPGFWSHPWLLALRDAVLVGAYFTLAWMAARQEEAENR